MFEKITRVTIACICSEIAGHSVLRKIFKLRKWAEMKVFCQKLPFSKRDMLFSSGFTDGSGYATAGQMWKADAPFT